MRVCNLEPHAFSFLLLVLYFVKIKLLLLFYFPQSVISPTVLLRMSLALLRVETQATAVEVWVSEMPKVTRIGGRVSNITLR